MSPLVGVNSLPARVIKGLKNCVEAFRAQFWRNPGDTERIEQKANAGQTMHMPFSRCNAMCVFGTVRLCISYHSCAQRPGPRPITLELAASTRALDVAALRV
jgi:hypothetical protein